MACLAEPITACESWLYATVFILWIKLLMNRSAISMLRHRSYCPVLILREVAKFYEKKQKVTGYTRNQHRSSSSASLRSLAVHNLQRHVPGKPRYAMICGRPGREAALRNVIRAAKLVNRVHQGFYVLGRCEL